MGHLIAIKKSFDNLKIVFKENYNAIVKEYDNDPEKANENF